MPPDSNAERRLAPRYAAQLNVSATVGDGAPAPLLCTSISETGLFLRSAQPVPVGAAVSVRIDLPYGTVALRGVVRRAVSEGSPEAPGFGIEIAQVVEGPAVWASLVRTARVRAPAKID